MGNLVNDAVIPLCDTRRWETYPTIIDESVGEHTFMVSMVSYRIALAVDSADVGDVLERALLHDLEEIGTGDIPRWAKHRNEALEDALTKTEESFVREACSGEPQQITDHIVHKWEVSKDKGDIEGEIVACADIICAILGAYREMRMGNQALWDEADLESGLEDAYDICQRIKPAFEILDDLVVNRISELD